MIYKGLADFAERFIRNRRAYTLTMVLVAYPAMGAGIGLIANIPAIFISQAPASINHIALAGLVALLIAVCELLGARYRESTGDAANHGLTRVFGIPWILSHERRLAPSRF